MEKTFEPALEHLALRGLEVKLMLGLDGAEHINQKICFLKTHYLNLYSTFIYRSPAFPTVSVSSLRQFLMPALQLLAFGSMLVADLKATPLMAQLIS
jgi:hypothetical protein